MKETLILKRTDIEKIMTIKDAVAAVEEVFRLYGESKAEMPPKVYLQFPKGDLRSMPSYVPDWGVAGVKNVNVHPQNTNLPTVMATFTLIDASTGFPLAIMDATYITRLRTGASGAIASRYLAKKDAQSVGIVGAGIQAMTQLSALLVTKPEVSKVKLFDIDLKKAEAFAAAVRSQFSVEVEVFSSLADLVPAVDILTTITPVRSPIIQKDMVRPGLHINAIGADAQGKQELDPALLKKAKVIVDNWEQASHSGEINVAVSEGLFSEKDLFATLSQIITGQKEIDRADDDISIFDSTGLAIQDLACAFSVYKKLNEDRALLEKVEKLSLV